jgi:enoyl-[acyl-carrier-protein] reductase (NADH)
MENFKLPIALVLAMAAQLAGGVWWVSQQASTISGLEETVSQLGSRMAIEDNINLKRDVANNSEDIDRIWDEIEEAWDEMAGLASMISRVTEVQQRVAIIENELKYISNGVR